jgi:hypothetical protein
VSYTFSFFHQVLPAFFGSLDYDKEEMIPDAAETVLGYFCFDRTVHGNKNTAARKRWWLEEIKTANKEKKAIRMEMMGKQ